MIDTEHKTGTYRGPGWWLPVPRSRFDADNGPERDARFRLVGAWIIRFWMVIVASFGGLMWSDRGVTHAQAFFGTTCFLGGTGMVLALLMSFVWFAP